MASAKFPSAVLTESIAEEINGRPIRTAVFTTYSFDPGFFELHILPTLFTRSFSQTEKVKLIQLEEALRSIGEVAVYYDRTAISQEALPAQLDFRRIDVRRKTGVFHPKLVLLLVENYSGDNDEELDDAPRTPDSLSLIVGVLSANLTRSGWWENVETGHVEIIDEKTDSYEHYPFRRDLLFLLNQIKKCSAENEQHSALDQIRDFLRNKVNRRDVINNSARGRWYTRIFYGQDALPAWLDQLGLTGQDWNIEIISPYFDESDPRALRKLRESFLPCQPTTHIYLPVDEEGKARISEDLYTAVKDMSGCYWSTLPSDILWPGARKATEAAMPRSVHAKVYRFWRGGSDSQAITLVGSANLTSAGHSHAGAGNLETAFLVDITDVPYAKEWWLDRLDYEPEKFEEHDPAEDEESEKVFIDLSLRYNWRSGVLSYRSAVEHDAPIEVCEPSGRKLFALSAIHAKDWQDCTKEAANAIKQLLVSTSFVMLKANRGSWRAMVREEGMSHRPSLVRSLTPEEILEYWSQLSAEQKEYFIGQKLVEHARRDGLHVDRKKKSPAEDSVFTRFSGLFHAFERLYDGINQALELGHDGEAVTRLFGRKFDSLPVLLNKMEEQESGDPVMRYITFLCASQLCKRIQKHYPEFISSHQEEFQSLSQQANQSDNFREEMKLGEDNEKDFWDWYESMFLREAVIPEQVSE